MNNTIYFLHGLDSSGKGTKGRYFSDHFPQVICPDFSGSLAQRLEQLSALCGNRHDLLFIGSSYGGLMATCFALNHPDRVSRLILLAPALNFEDYHPPAAALQIPTLLVVGNKDTVTPAAAVVPLAKATFADLEIRLADDDHLLHDSFAHLNWQKLLAG